MANKIALYSLPNMLNEYRKNLPLINAYLKGETIEGMDDGAGKIIGVSIGVFLLVFLLTVGVFLWGLILLITRWNEMEEWACIVGLVCLFIGLPVVTIILAYVSKK